MMIKRFLAATLAALMLASGVVAPAAAMDWLINSYRFGAATPTPTLTFIGCTASTTDASSHTFTSHSVGTAGANRDTIVGVYGTDDATAFSATALTVGGDAATAVVNPTSISQAASAIFFLDNPVGTSENIVVTWSESILGAVVCVWAAYDLTVETAKAAIGDSDASAGVLTLNMNTNDDGIAVGICGGRDGNDRNATWVGLTEQVEGSNTTGEFLNWSAAQLAPTSEVNPLAASCDWDTALDGSSGAAATWDNSPAPPATPSITFLQCVADATNLTTYTYTSQNVGTAGSNRHTIVGVFGGDNATGTSVSSVTVGGDAATEIADSGGTGVQTVVALYIVSNPAGTSENIVTTFSAGINNAAICLWDVKDLNSATAVASLTDNEAAAAALTLSVNTSADGVAVGVCNSLASGVSTTWSGLTERGDLNAGGEGHDYSPADFTEDGTASTPLAITCDWSGSANSSGAAASFR